MASCDIGVMSGDDSLTLPLMALGADGVVSVAANVAPARVKAIVSAALKGDFAAARAAHRAIMELVRSLFLETNPIPVKTALRLMGRINGQLRLPLCPPSAETEKALGESLSALGLIP